MSLLLLCAPPSRRCCSCLTSYTGSRCWSKWEDAFSNRREQEKQDTGIWTHDLRSSSSTWVTTTTTAVRHKKRRLSESHSTQNEEFFSSSLIAAVWLLFYRGHSSSTSSLSLLSSSSTSSSSFSFLIWLNRSQVLRKNLSPRRQRRQRRHRCRRQSRRKSKGRQRKWKKLARWLNVRRTNNMTWRSGWVWKTNRWPINGKASVVFISGPVNLVPCLGFPLRPHNQSQVLDLGQTWEPPCHDSNPWWQHPDFLSVHPLVRSDWIVHWMLENVEIELMHKSSIGKSLQSLELVGF